MATKKVKEEKEVKVTKAAPKAKKAAPKAKAAPTPQLTKDDVQAAVYTAVKAAVLEVKAAEPKPEVKEAPKCIKYTSDERLMKSLAIICLVVGLIVSAACIIGGIILEVQKDSFLAQYIDGPDMGIILLVSGVCVLLVTLVQYACMSLFANISHRLTSLDKKH